MLTTMLAPVLPLRACVLCEHGRDVNGLRHCLCTDVVPPSQRQHGAPVELLRSPFGACGPEAIHMRAPFLRAR